MSASGYTAWNVTAGEVPTTAYWNILGYNDASFNTGNGFNDGILQSRHFGAASVLSAALGLGPTSAGGTQTFTPAINSTSGLTMSTPTCYYVNLGGIKWVWGMFSFSSSAGQGHGDFSLPTFLTTVQTAVAWVQSEGNAAYQVISGDTVQTNHFPFYVNNTSTVSTAGCGYLIIGT